MSWDNRRPAEGGSPLGGLIVAGIVVLVLGGIWFASFMHERAESQRAAEEAARKKDAEAQGLIAELAQLPPGRIDEFNRGAERREDFARANPSFKEAFDGAEDEWMGRTVAALDAQTAADPAAAVAAATQLDRGCGERGAARFRPQAREALDRAVAAAAARGGELLERDPVQALDFAGRCLQPFDRDPPESLTAARQRALDRCVTDLTARLDKAAPDDAAAMNAWLKDGKAVEQAARSPVEPLRQAEGRWLTGTVAAVLKEVEPRATKDPAAAFARLTAARTTYAELLSAHPEADRELTAGEGRCLQAVVDQSLTEAELLLLCRDAVAASAVLADTAAVCAGPLRTHAEPARRLLDARRRAVDAALDAARAEARGLIQGNRFQAAASRADQLCKDIGAEADAVGTGAALTRFRDECGYFADLARKAGQADPP